MTSEIDLMRKAIKQYDKALRLKQINENLYEHLTGSIYYVLRYAEKHQIALPDKSNLIDMIEKADFLIDQFAKPARRNLTERKSDKDLTEPKFTKTLI